jgi:IrrE N-terminal-like domain
LNPNATVREAWPCPLLRVPRVAEAAGLAAEARRLALFPGGRHQPLQSFGAVSRKGRLQIGQKKLSAAQGQQEALLIPLAQNRFGIWVDPTPHGGWRNVPLGMRAEVRRHRYRFRVAHEIAHTMFYDRTGDRPRRFFRGSPEEELFCDEFARSLLVPPAVARKRSTPTGVLGLHRQYGVSVEVAARAVAAARSDLRVGLWYRDLQQTWHVQWTNASPTDTARMLDTAHEFRGRSQAVAVCA